MIIEGETGFVVDSLDQMIAAVSQVHHISPTRCCEHVASRFGVYPMVEGFVAIDHRIYAEFHGVSVRSVP